MPSLRSQNRPLGFAACAIASMLWGCGFFFGKIALREMNVGAMVLYRFLFACIGLLPLLVRHKPQLNGREWRQLALCAAMGVPLQFLIQFRGLSLTTVSHASLMVGTMPVMLALGATLFARERLSALGWVSLAGSTAGAVLIVLGKASAGRSGQAPTLAGDLLVVLSLMICLVWVLMNKSLMQRHSSVSITVWGTLLGTAMLAVIVPVLYGWPPVHISAGAWGASVGAGLLCTGATTLLWNWGLTQVPASQAGVLLNMEPLIGSLLGVALLGERLEATAFAGGLLIVLAAVVLTVSSSRAAKAVAEAPESQ
ncbi:MAG: EamA family transporter [Acidobacteriaceae bacterium]|nr:EamA family transporter [Acidobacteriaceae bacterium]